MSNTTIEPTIKSITFKLDRLPLAVYREMAAHLRQVEGVKTDLLPQTATNFDYLQSQVGGLNIAYPSDSSISSIEIKVKSIIRHYENKYGKLIEN
ncbi:hypothetical protein [Geminocystis herdmanii]|uniref:hypothetical protein n=1 Tax=Geminocystis herdmanii TaxID=669359 RepID=UPI00034D0962|nr:hypothetical protein [Geminocystis herdmanii]